MSQQSSISSFFKAPPVKTDSSPAQQPPLKKRKVKEPQRIKTPPPPKPLSDRTKHWHIDDTSHIVLDSPEKQARRAKFVEKLGELDQRRQAREDDPEDDVGSEAEEAEEEDVPSELAQKFALPSTSAKKGKKVVERATDGTKLTPLEIQIQKIQAENPNTMLLVEVGYKYRFFGPDARAASQILGIACFKSHSFLSASVPVHRLSVHVNRLVKAGKKVGVVRQIETAALKAVGENRNKTFERKLCEVYSKGTYLGDDIDDNVGGWIIAITEDSLQLSSQFSNVSSTLVGIQKEVRIGVVAIRPESGEVVWDAFEDTSLRGELEKRLLMLDVIEIVAVGELSQMSSKTFTLPGKRLEAVSRPPFAEAKKKVEEFYNSQYSTSDAAPVLAKIRALPDVVLECLHAQMQYLAEFSLESVFTLTNFFQPFETKMCLQLPATTISALEIFRNSTDNTEKGSLFWVLDSTRTLPGRRLLRRWLTRPLTVRADLIARQDAIQEIVDAKGTPFAQIDEVKKMLRKLPDLDKGLSKIYYGKSSRPDILKTLQAFFRVSRTFDPRASFAFTSPSLKDTFSSFTTIADIIDGFLAEINHVETAKDDKYNMFKETDTLDQISDHKMGILIVESDLTEHLAEIGKTLKRKHVEYVSVAGVEYLIEIKNDATKLVPPDWLKMSGTKFVSRFHTPKITKLVAERDQRKELLAIECDKAYNDFMKRISMHYDTLRWIVSSIAEVDCLFSLAVVSSQPGYTRPIFLPTSSPTAIKITDARHPIIEKILTAPFIPNSVDLATNATQTVILTGPNMGGKSSYIKQVALCCILAHLGCFVPCTAAELTILDGIYCRIGASDRILQRESTFMVELHEVSDILAQATSSSLVILDELGRGTATLDGLAISHAVLHYFQTHVRSLLLFVTHYPSLSSLTREFATVETKYMAYLQLGSDDIEFLYKLTDGVAGSSYGLNVARLARLPASILATATAQARVMELDIAARERRSLEVRIEEVMKGDEAEEVSTVLDLIRLHVDAEAG